MTATAELPPGRVHTPLLKRISSFLSLVSLVVIMGFAVAALLGAAAVGLLLLFDAAAT